MLTEHEKKKLTRRAGYLSILTAFILLTAKVFIGLNSGSSGVLASALDSGLDFISSAINLLALIAAQAPATQRHRYGHGKAEALAGFLQGIVIFASGFYILANSIYRYFDPVEITHESEAMMVMGLSLALTALLVSYQKYVLRKTDSLVITADSLHYVTDIGANVAVIAGLLFTKYLGWFWADITVGVLIAAYVLISASDILTRSINILMDKDISNKYREGLKEVIAHFKPDILGYHDLRTRSAGDHDFIEFHLEMPKDLTLEKSHDLVESLMSRLRKRYRNVEIIIHSDPVVINKNGEKIRLLDTEKPRFY